MASIGSSVGPIFQHCLNEAQVTHDRKKAKEYQVNFEDRTGNQKFVGSLQDTTHAFNNNGVPSVDYVCARP